MSSFGAKKITSELCPRLRVVYLHFIRCVMALTVVGKTHGLFFCLLPSQDGNTAIFCEAQLCYGMLDSV